MEGNLNTLKKSIESLCLQRVLAFPISSTLEVPICKTVISIGQHDKFLSSPGEKIQKCDKFLQQTAYCCQIIPVLDR